MGCLVVVLTRLRPVHAAHIPVPECSVGDRVPARPRGVARAQGRPVARGEHGGRRGVRPRGGRRSGRRGLCLRRGGGRGETRRETAQVVRRLRLSAPRPRAPAKGTEMWPMRSAPQRHAAAVWRRPPSRAPTGPSPSEAEISSVEPLRCALLGSAPGVSTPGAPGTPKGCLSTRPGSSDVA